MTVLRVDSESPETFLMINLTEGTVWQGTELSGCWKLVGELPPGVVQVWRNSV